MKKAIITDEIKKNRGENLKSLMERYKISNTRLAEEFNCKPSQLSSWKVGGYEKSNRKDYLTDSTAIALKGTLDNMRELRGAHVRLDYLLANDSTWMTEEESVQSAAYSKRSPGYWIHDEDWECSVCHTHFSESKFMANDYGAPIYNYCPICGADLTGI